MIFAQAITQKDVADATGFSNTAVLVIYIVGLLVVAAFTAFNNYRTNKKFERFSKELEAKNQRELASHTAKLNRDNELELSAFKSKLEISAAERNIKLTKVFDKQAEVIAETYKKLVEYRRAVHHLLGTAAPEGQKINQETLTEARAKREVFLDYFEPIVIYLPPDTADQCWNYWKHLYRVSISHTDMKTTSEDIQQSLKEMRDFVDQSKTVLDLLENDFRHILGLTTKEHEKKQGS